MQAAVFTTVEGATNSTVMVTGNLRQAIETVFVAISPSASVGMWRRSGISAAVGCAFGFGAAIGALVTERVPDLALGLSAIALLFVLLRCNGDRHGAGHEASV